MGYNMNELFETCKRYNINLVHFSNLQSLLCSLCHEIELELISIQDTINICGDAYISDSEIVSLKKTLQNFKYELNFL